MAISLVQGLAIAISIALALYKFIVEPAFLSPLSKIPNAHWSSPFSSFWILNQRRQNCDTPTVHEAHKKYGPIIRLAPKEISVNSVEGGIRTVYAGGFAKGDWYRNAFNNYGHEPMFSMAEHAPHSKRRRMLSNIYAKSTLQASPAIATISKVLLEDRFIPRLQTYMENDEAVEMFDVFSAITLDFVTAYVFGLQNASDFINHPDMGRNSFFNDFRARQISRFWPQEMPRLTRFLKAVGLKWLVVPNWVGQANFDLESWILKRCDQAEVVVQQFETTGEKPEPQNWPNSYAQLRSALLKEFSSSVKDGKNNDVKSIVHEHRLEIASEMLDHSLAGYDTSSVILTFLAWELSRPQHLNWQKRLQDEILTLDGRRSAKELDNLPVLHAILMETLRLHASIPGNQPRITPAGATLGAPGHVFSNIPANVRVHAQAWSLHREPSVFPDPETWQPARWLDSKEAQLVEMTRWFWAFGSGGRMCIGSNLAMLDMKAIIVALWGEFRTTLVDGEGMVHGGGYEARPKGKDGKYCVVKLEPPDVRAE